MHLQNVQSDNEVGINDKKMRTIERMCEQKANVSEREGNVHI